jgi:hypothetical protein
METKYGKEGFCTTCGKNTTRGLEAAPPAASSPSTICSQCPEPIFNFCCKCRIGLPTQQRPVCDECMKCTIFSYSRGTRQELPDRLRSELRSLSCNLRKDIYKVHGQLTALEKQIRAIDKLLTDNCKHNMILDHSNREPCGPSRRVCTKCGLET